MIERLTKPYLQIAKNGPSCEVCEKELPSHEWADLATNGLVVRCSFVPWVGNRHESRGYRLLMEEIRMADWEDPYGTATEWYFATAAVLWMESPEAEQINGFHPSPLYVKGDWNARFKPDGYAVERTYEMYESGHVRLGDLRRINLMVTRFMGWCRVAGRDY